MKKLSVLIICILMSFSIAEASFLDNLPIITRDISGFVLNIQQNNDFKSDNNLVVDKDLALNRDGLFRASLLDDKVIIPASATISVGDITVNTDERGFFYLKKSIFGLSQQNLVLSFKNKSINVPLIKENTVPFFVFLINDKKVSVYRLKKENNQYAKKPVFMLHGSRFNDFFYISQEDNLKTFDKTLRLLKDDYELSDFAFYKFNYSSEQDIVKSSFYLSSAIFRYKKIFNNNSPVILVGYGLGGLVIRHYTVSKSFIPDSVEKIILIGTPNHGYSFLIAKDRQSSKEMMRNSDFLKALNKEEGAYLVERYRINPSLQARNGLNPDIKTYIIAGNVSQKIKRSLKKFSHKAEYFIKRFVKELHEIFNEESPSHNGQYQEFERYLEENIEKIPDGDMIVSLNSAMIEGVKTIVIEYSHTKLIQPKDRNDIRYLILKDILLGRK